MCLYIRAANSHLTQSRIQLQYVKIHIPQVLHATLRNYCGTTNMHNISYIHHSLVFHCSLYLYNTIRIWQKRNTGKHVIDIPHQEINKQTQRFYAQEKNNSFGSTVLSHYKYKIYPSGAENVWTVIPRKLIYNWFWTNTCKSADLSNFR